MAIMHFETWYKYTKNSAVSRRGMRLKALDEALKNWHTCFNKMVANERGTKEWADAEGHVRCAYSTLARCFNEYVRHKVEQHGPLLGKRNRQMTERYSDPYASQRNNMYDEAMVSAEKQAKLEASSLLNQIDDSSFSSFVSSSADVAGAKVDRFTESVERMFGGRSTSDHTGDPVIFRLGKQISAEGLRLMSGFYDAKSNELRDQLNAQRLKLFHKTFAGAQFSLLSGKIPQVERSRVPFQLEQMAANPSLRKSARNQSGLSKAVGGMKDAQSVVSFGDLSEMLGTIKEIIQAALDIKPEELMDGTVGTLIKDTLGEAAKEFAKEALPIAGLVLKGVKTVSASAALAKTILQRKEVERASQYLFNTGDLGKAMDALKRLMAEAIAEAGLALAEAVVGLTTGLVEHFVPGSSVATKSVDLAMTVAKIVKTAVVRIRFFQAMRVANTLLVKGKMLGAMGLDWHSILMLKFPLAGAYMLRKADASELLLCYADIQGSLDAIPILKKEVKIHVGPVKAAAERAIDAGACKLIVTDASQRTAADGDTGDELLSGIELAKEGVMQVNDILGLRSAVKELVNYSE